MADALTTHRHIHHPADDGVTATLVLLHGTGGDERQLLDLGRAIAPGAGRLGVRGNVVEDGRVQRWFRRLREGVFDTEDVISRADDLGRFLDAAVETYQLDPTGLIAVGFSNGANIGAATMLRRPDLVRAGVFVSAMLPFDPADRPDLSANAAVLIQGRDDPHAPPEQAEALASLLADGGASVDVRWHDDGHALGPAQAHEAQTWLRRYMTATAASPDGSPA